MFISVKDGVLRKIKDELGDDSYYKFSSRVQIWADTEAFRWKEDESVWAQKREKIANHFSIYMDGVFISGFDENEPIEKVMLEFWKGLKAQIEKKNLDLDPFKHAEMLRKKEIERIESEKMIKNEINKLDESTPTRKLAKEVVKRATATGSNTRRKKHTA